MPCYIPSKFSYSGRSNALSFIFTTLLSALSTHLHLHGLCLDILSIGPLNFINFNHFSQRRKKLKWTKCSLIDWLSLTIHNIWTQFSCDKKRVCHRMLERRIKITTHSIGLNITDGMIHITNSTICVSVIIIFR